jgi:hypothetical protein
VGARTIKLISARANRGRRFAVVTLALLAMSAQLLIAVLPLAVATTHSNPFQGAALHCHFQGGSDEGLPAQSNGAPTHHPTDCPLCFALHQLASYVPVAEPAVAPSAEPVAASMVTATPSTVPHFHHSSQQPRAPPVPA